MVPVAPILLFFRISAWEVTVPVDQPMSGLHQSKQHYSGAYELGHKLHTTHVMNIILISFWGSIINYHNNQWLVINLQMYFTGHHFTVSILRDICWQAKDLWQAKKNTPFLVAFIKLWALLKTCISALRMGKYMC